MRRRKKERMKRRRMKENGGEEIYPSLLPSPSRYGGIITISEFKIKK
jgi:hypothetical protein